MCSDIYLFEIKFFEIRVNRMVARIKQNAISRIKGVENKIVLLSAIKSTRFGFWDARAPFIEQDVLYFFYNRVLLVLPL